MIQSPPTRAHPLNGPSTSQQHDPGINLPAHEMLGDKSYPNHCSGSKKNQKRQGCAAVTKMEKSMNKEQNGY